MSSANDTTGEGTAVVTGGGSGIGKAISRWLATRGVNPVLADIDEASVRDAAEEINRADDTTGRALGIHTDVTSESSVQSLIERALGEFGEINYLFANAGVSGPVELEDTDFESWKQVMDINLNGVFLSVKKALPSLREADGTSHVIVTSSISGRKPKSIMMPYRTSKAAVLMLTHCLASREGPDVKVNALCPGPIETPLQEELYQRRAEKEGVPVEQYMQEGDQLGPLGRSPTKQDILNLLDFVLFQDGFVHGHEFYLDGGSYQAM